MPESTDGTAPEQGTGSEGETRRRDAYRAFLGHVVHCSYCARGAGHCTRGETLRSIWRRALVGT
ncbi:hypothetical protein [Streptomyces sp. NPDC087525]|uniref:hypothetical protein n=1 Tax=Streptomyces sp. NPDC087525 TaxID=3365793 RepID=UPI00380EAD5B